MPVEIADLASADKELYDKKVSYVRDGRYKEDAMAIGDLGLTFRTSRTARTTWRRTRRRGCRARRSS
jgi:hypothetical protein